MNHPVIQALSHGSKTWDFEIPITTIRKSLSLSHVNTVVPSGNGYFDQHFMCSFLNFHCLSGNSKLIGKQSYRKGQRLPGEQRGERSSPSA